MAKKEKDYNAIKARRIDSRPFSEIGAYTVLLRSKKKKRVNRSKAGDITLFVFLAIAGSFSMLPLLLTFFNAFKPLNELFLYPPRLWVANPTLVNFIDLANALGNSLVPFSRYFFNTILVTFAGTLGHIIIASMCAYPLAKYKIPGGSLIMGIIVYSLMFPGSVTAIPHYLIFNVLGMIDTQWSLILPSIASSLGLFLMRQFMTQVPTDYIESAKLDGAGDMKILWKIVMPIVKPAWLTLLILLFQSLWAASGAQYIYREDLKMVSYAITQIATAGPARQGTLAAVSLIMILVPISVFVITQSQVMETMAHSGMK
ncbi:MAG: carbohydrate ABC transporter permease [Bacilli bacterium]|nr:carbohydrate ABC transporter permease [Bacilli bacterium]